MILTGTCGYSYREWRDVFYPAALRPSGYLAHYAKVFPSVEIDSTFYRVPTRSLLEKWVSLAPSLSFCLKAPRPLTHERGERWAEDALLFSRALGGMEERLGAVLFQFPQSFRRTRENRRYLSSLLSFFSSFPRVVEFRHREWGREEVLASLRERGVGFCVCDMPSLSALPCMMDVVTSDIGYVRFHGRNGEAWYGGDCSSRYSYTYGEEELRKSVPIVRSIEEKSKVTYVFFNNHRGGAAVMNARRMMALLSS